MYVADSQHCGADIFHVLSCFSSPLPRSISGNRWLANSLTQQPLNKQNKWRNDVSGVFTVSSEQGPEPSVRPVPPPPPALHVILAAQEKKRCGPEEPFWSHSWTGVDPITLASAKPRGGRVRELSLSRPCPIVFLPDETEEQFYANQHV